MQLIRTGEKIAFLDLGIGSPFFAHGKFWTRTAFEAGTVLQGSLNGLSSSCCNFLIDGTVEPRRGPYKCRGELCEEVEAVKVTQ